MKTEKRRARAICAQACNSVVESLEARRLLAGVGFDIEFVDSGAYSSYFNQVRTVLTQAGNEWAKYFNGAGATLELDVRFKVLDSPILAQARPDMTFDRMVGGTSVFEPSAMKEIRTGIDPDPSTPDGFVEINVDVLSDLHFGGTPVPANKYDAFTLLTHELGHVLGFTGWANDATGQTAGSATQYDLLIEKSGSDFYFTGSNARQTYGSNVPLARGSVHHYGNRTGPGADLDGLMMSVSMGTGERQYVAPIDLAILKDVGMPILSGPTGAVVIVRSVDAVASESGPDHGRFRFERSGPTTEPLQITYTLSGSATAGSDYAPLSGTVTIPAGAAFVDLDLTVIDDTIPEGSETVIVTIDSSADYLVGASPAATIVIQDNDGGVIDNRPGVYVRAIDGEAGESRGGMGIFRFYRTGTSTTALNVNYTITGTALAGTDYYALPGSVTIPAGQLYTDILVRAIDDNIIESTETVILTITPGSGYQFAGQTTSTITILDNDGDYTEGTMIMGTVFNDHNANGWKDADDKAIYGWVVWIDSNSNGVMDVDERRAMINGNGRYVFDRLAAGTYNVATRPVSSDWRRTSPGSLVQQVTVVEGQINTGRDFGFTNSARVAGYVFSDTDLNGAQQGIEHGLANWYVYIDANNNGIFDKGERITRSNARGFYMIDGLEHGNHAVRVHTKLGWQMTVRTPSTILPLSLNVAQVMSGYNFAVGPRSVL